MEYRRLGRAGLKVSALSFGSWVTFSFQVDTEAADRIMGAAYDAGINFFDNAEVYAAGESERIMGEVLARSGWGRDTYCVSSKVYWGGDLPTQRGLHRKHIHDACHAALRRLQVDYLDLFFCHRPDLETPIEETVRAMDDLIRQGKVLYWGTSEWSAQQIQEAHGLARQYGLTPPTMEQPQYNMLHRDRVEREYHRLYEEVGLGTTIWSPLASGILTNKYADGIPDGSRMSLPDYDWLRERMESPEGRKQIAMTTALKPVADDLGCSMAQMAIAWCLKNPRVSTVILGASRVEQLDENLAALDVVGKLDDEVMQRIETILDNKPELPQQW
ncbi:MAG: voltage-dependent potassium channel subunit beta [Acidobacteria bacterium]|nr:voltage-dependent potassium channel subunit beta [Acidobacteriota bacterium]NIM62843.1 voltage-dependent potassium channel subunit beta [Acidobacteriota bacterium]NIO60473.1 voltage-dependent potassium channel subunit beta [Acidobacteriota bacterium]NIQ31579.1 voltage-dependent potassium channel subunit beta [Acidobacteriota bacterium]NIQ86829.1 voltage-dependent potassium channel subunit beta [Acidobacteriota bacterium]